jgi:hypothetical protein
MQHHAEGPEPCYPQERVLHGKKRLICIHLRLVWHQTREIDRAATSAGPAMPTADSKQGVMMATMHSHRGPGPEFLYNFSRHGGKAACLILQSGPAAEAAPEAWHTWT